MKEIAIVIVILAVVFFSGVSSVKETPSGEYKYAVEFYSILNFWAERYAQKNNLHYVKEGFKTVILTNNKNEFDRIVRDNS
jgi:hypothetical protein